MGFSRMVNGTVFFIIFVVVLIIFYAVFIHPLIYITDSLNTAYEEVSDEMEWTDAGTVKGGLVSIVWLFVIGICFAIGLLFVYLIALSHKEEHDVAFR